MMKLKLITNRYNISIISSLFIFLGHQVTYAGSCCGGSASLPQLITNDDQAQVGASLTQSKQTGQHLSDDTILKYRHAEPKENLNISGQKIFLDRYQVGLSLDATQKHDTMTKRKYHGLRKVQGQLGYELLPEYTYSLWRPKLFLSFQQDFPLGKSEHEMTVASYQHDRYKAISDGLIQTHLAIVAVKQYLFWDFSLLLQGHYSYPRLFTPTNEMSRQIDSRYGYTAGIGTGYSPLGGNLRIGISLEESWFTPKTLSSYKNGTEIFKTRDAQDEMITQWGVQLSYMLANYTISLNYSDNSLLKKMSYNTSLSQTVGMTLKRRFFRN